MKKREEHCAFAQLNTNGRCTACCHYNEGPVDEDCTGKEGETFDHPFKDDSMRRKLNE